MKIFRKIVGALLLSSPALLVSWVLAEITYQPIWFGAILFLFGAAVIVAIVDALLILLVIMTVGQRLWKGESIEWHKL